MEEADMGPERSSSALIGDLAGVRIGPVEQITIEGLVFTDRVRCGGEDLNHSRMLAALAHDCTPILVHRHSMVVLDGLHRVCAARHRGQLRIAAQLVEGSIDDCFVLAVRANTMHGKPLTLAERQRSAERILGTHPYWSDRAIAETCGLSGKTVAQIRERATEEFPQLSSGRRIGRDGRARPIDPGENRRRAAELLRATPGASLREIARQAGLSPATVKDVRERLERSDPPETTVVADELRDTQASLVDQSAESPLTCGVDRPTVLEDVALRSTYVGASFAEWFAPRLISQEEWLPFVESIPVSRIYDVADQARACAASWRAFADTLERRVRGKNRRAG
jgi:transposase-like protein